MTIDDDPGADIGAAGKVGHRFFFGLDQVEPLPGRQEANAQRVHPRRASSWPASGTSSWATTPSASTSPGACVRARFHRTSGSSISASAGLAYALLDGCDVAILVDAIPRGGEPPGTLYVIEPQLSDGDDLNATPDLMEPHSMDPAKVLRLVRVLGGGQVPRVALVGYLATENDADRLARSGAPVRQIVTGTVCHLEAEMVRGALGGWDLADLDYLFIENVGNLVCPSSYDLGEDLRVVLMSTTEGEDKPLKYPTIFNTADIAMITKIDLAEATEFDRARAAESIERVRPGMTVLEVSARRGRGMEDWIDSLEFRRRQKSWPAATPLTTTTDAIPIHA